MYVEVVKESVPYTFTTIFGDVRKKTFGGSNYHIHNEIEIMYVADGCIKWDFQNISFVARKGDLIFVNSRIPHATKGIESGVASIVIQFDADKLLQENPVQYNKYLKRLLYTDDIPFYHFKENDSCKDELREYLLKIYDEKNGNKKAHHIYIKSYIFSIIGFLHRNNFLSYSEDEFSNKADIEKIMPFLTYIDKNYQNDITLKDMSNYFGLNPSYICRLFKKATNSTFTRYLNLVRIVNAEILLTTTNDSIIEVALSVGFPNVSYFNLTFKKASQTVRPDFIKK